MTDHANESIDLPTPIPEIQGMRILLGPGDTASFPTRLARALAQRGAACWVVDFSLHRYSAGPGKLGKAKLWGGQLARLIASLLSKGGLSALLGSALKTLGQLLVFFWALVRVDALVFVSSRSLLPGYLDLPVYRLLGKRVIRVFLGTDSRPRYMTGWHPRTAEPATRPKSAKRLAQRVRRQRMRVRWMSRWADVVIDNPLCGHFQNKPFINWFHVGFPHDPAFFADRDRSASDEPAKPQAAIRLLHCPSNPQIKGTDRIEAVIHQLKAQGIAIDYTRITGMPHALVLGHLSNCDLVIDELYSDSPMAGFASEAVAFGKPVIVGGYGWTALRDRLGAQMPPNLLCTPEQLEQTVRDAMSHPDRARMTGRDAQAFLNGYWHHTAVADRFAKLLTGKSIPEHWWVDPRSIDYWQGLGATDEHRRAVIEALVASGGMQALGLDPALAVYKTIEAWSEQS